MLSINAAVGRDGINSPDDVMIVQALLNKNLLPPLRLLDVSGKCDDSTIFAITEFQRRVIKMPKPDGRVDAGGKTIQVLMGQAPKPKPGHAPTLGNIATSVAKPTAMRQTAWDYLLAFTIKHEGAVLYMYNNRTSEKAKQDVTCGVGVLLESPDVAARPDIMNMFYDPQTQATPTSQQMRADWDAASKLLRNRNLLQYGVVCHMRMYAERAYEKMALILRDQKLPPLMKLRDYGGFGDMPAAAQTFCLSFAYGRIPIDFPAMNACIGRGDWKGASSQCHMNGASELKNKAHANLLLFAQRVVDEKMDLDTMPATLDGV